jgi:hypothetical protein
MSTTTNKTLEYIASSKFIVDSAQNCFNHCIEDFNRKELIPLEKHCIEGCIAVKFGLFSSVANNKSLNIDLTKA